MKSGCSKLNFFQRLPCMNKLKAKSKHKILKEKDTNKDKMKRYKLAN